MTKRYITGSNGFIGSHLLKRLGKFDGLTFGVKHSYFYGNHRWDADQLFFLSTYGNMATHSDTRMMVQANVEDLITVLEHFKGWLCYMSSSSVLLPVQTQYSRTKRAAEEIIQSFTDVKSCIVRPYSVTGVGEQKEHLIPTLIRSCMEGEEMPFDPDPIHDFVDVEDVVDRLVHLSSLQLTGIYHLGSGQQRANCEVRTMVEYVTDKKANVKYVKGIRNYDSKNWYCREPSFAPYKKTLLQSITEMVEAYIIQRALKETAIYST